MGLLIKEKNKRKNKVEPYGKKEKFKIKIKLPNFWWLVAGWIIIALFSGIFRGTDDMPDYMTTIDDKGNNIQDPSLYQDPDDEDNIKIYNNTFYPASSSSSSNTFANLFDRFPTMMILMLGMVIGVPFIMFFFKGFRRW